MNAVQEKEFEILKNIQEIFTKHGLRYFAVGGTCIGAIRHNGFIPWDDDIDIGMPREDYEIFRNQYYKELPPYYKKLDCDNSFHHSYSFMKIHDSRTTYVEKYAQHSPDRYTGVFVDIMPVDGLPDGNLMNRVIKKVNRYVHFNYLTRPEPYYGSSAWIKLKFFGKNLMSKVFGYNYFSNKTVRLMSKYNYDTSNHVYFTWRAGIKRDRILFNKDFFESTIEVPFESGAILVPIGYHEYLTQDFGDYMKLPRIEEQTSVHSVIICDLTKPCEYYAKLEEERRK